LLGALVGRELERGQDYQIIESITQYREADGSISAATNSLTILATGMFYADNGHWLRIPPPNQDQRWIEHSVFAPISLPVGP
jgi:hypothetical protein